MDEDMMDTGDSNSHAANTSSSIEPRLNDKTPAPKAKPYRFGFEICPYPPAPSSGTVSDHSFSGLILRLKEPSEGVKGALLEIAIDADTGLYLVLSSR